MKLAQGMKAFAVSVGLLFAATSLPHRLWRTPPVAGYGLVAVEAAAFAFAWWGRLHLGRLWSGMITLREGHRVVDTGPYAYVRHPMYTGLLFFYIGMPLLLGSWWGVVVAFGRVLLLCARIPIEERVLRAGLDGYDAYTRRVRYRLIPGLW